MSEVSLEVFALYLFEYTDLKKVRAYFMVSIQIAGKDAKGGTMYGTNCSTSNSLCVRTITIFFDLENMIPRYDVIVENR